MADRLMSTENRVFAGTPFYMAPEQFRGKPRIASDQYALGIVVYEWLCGKPPFTEGDFLQLGFQHAYEPPSPLSDTNHSLPPAVEQVVLTALAKDSTKRFANVRAFATALEQASKSQLPPQSNHAAAEQARGPLPLPQRPVLSRVPQYYCLGSIHAFSCGATAQRRSIHS